MTDGEITFCVSRRKKQQKLGSNGTIFSRQGSGQRVCWGDSTPGLSHLNRLHVAIQPCLPFSADPPPSGLHWIHEIMHTTTPPMARVTPWASGLSPAEGGGRDWTK